MLQSKAQIPRERFLHDILADTPDIRARMLRARKLFPLNLGLIQRLPRGGV